MPRFPSRCGSRHGRSPGGPGAWCASRSPGGLDRADWDRRPDPARRGSPHDWLFPRVAAVVHHAGAGTTGSGLRAWVPAVPVPVLADHRSAPPTVRCGQQHASWPHPPPDRPGSASKPAGSATPTASACSPHKRSGYAEVAYAWASGLVAIPDELTPAEAAPLRCAAFTTFNALLKANASAGDLGGHPGHRRPRAPGHPVRGQHGPASRRLRRPSTDRMNSIVRAMSIMYVSCVSGLASAAGRHLPPTG